MDLDLRNRTALICGASQGLGLAVADVPRPQVAAAVADQARQEPGATVRVSGIETTPT